MEWPKVSIVVITRNEERNISDCLESLLSLDYPRDSHEIIVVDSSDDKTPEIVKKLPVRLVKSVKKGFGVARNIGIREANLDFIAFTDADCIVPRDWIKKLVLYLDSDVGGVGGNAYPPPISPYLGKCIACLGFPAGGALGLDEIYRKDGSNLDGIGTCNAIFRKDLLKMIGGFDSKLVYGAEDEEIGRRIREKGFFLRYGKESFVYHKTRASLYDFLAWTTRRGYAKAWKEKEFHGTRGSEIRDSFLLSRILKASVKKRNIIKIGLASILLIVPFLFLVKQSVMFIGYVKARKTISRVL